MSSISTVTLPATSTIKNQVYNFHSDKDNTDAVLTLSKKETEAVTYAVAVKYLGLDKGRCHWEVFLRNNENSESTNGLKYWGSRSFSFKVMDESCVRILEVDENKNLTYFVDLEHPSQLMYLHYPVEIRKLLAIAKEFKKEYEKDMDDSDSDNMELIDITYNDSIVFYGVKKERLELYVAEPGDKEFVKCEFKDNLDENGLTLDVEFKGTTHKFHVPNVGDYLKMTWDGKELNSL